MLTAQRIVKVIVDRDSVCAGDDCVSHEASFEISTSSTVDELLRKALANCPLAFISGGQATWLIDVEGNSKRCIGVTAQQWQAPKLTVAEDTTVEALFGMEPPALSFRYWCQSNPDAVFQAVLSGASLPSRYSTERGSSLSLPLSGQFPASGKLQPMSSVRTLKSPVTSNTKSRLRGLLIFSIGVSGMAYNWYCVIALGRYWLTVSFLLPIFACLGLSLMIYPLNKAESLERYGTEQIPWQHIPVGQKLLIVLGVSLAALQSAFLSGHLSI